MMKQLAFKLSSRAPAKAVRSIRYAASLKHDDINTEPDLRGCKAYFWGGTVLDLGVNIGVYARFCSELVGQASRTFELFESLDMLRFLMRQAHLDHMIGATSS